MGDDWVKRAAEEQLTREREGAQRAQEWEESQRRREQLWEKHYPTFKQTLSATICSAVTAYNRAIGREDLACEVEVDRIVVTFVKRKRGYGWLTISFKEPLKVQTANDYRCHYLDADDEHGMFMLAQKPGASSRVPVYEMSEIARICLQPLIGPRD